MLTIIILIVTVVTLSWIYSRYKLNYWKRRGVDSIPTNLIFGNFKDAIFFRSSPGWYMGQLHKTAKPDAPFVGFYIFHKPCLLLRDPEIIKDIMIRNFDHFHDRHFGGCSELDSSGMRNLFAMRNQTWKYLRNKITPTLSKSKLNQMLPLMLEICQPMMKYLKNQPTNADNTKLIDVQDVNDKYTTDLISTIALGTKTDSFLNTSKFTTEVAKFFHGFKKMVALVIVFFMPELTTIFGSSLLYNSRIVKKMFWDEFRSREKSGEKRGDFIDSLILLKNGEQNPNYSDNLLHQSGLFFSGFESSSNSASFTLMELAKHPEYQELARQDINRAIEKYGWTYEAFNNMQYIDQVITESLRIHPPISTIDRVVSKNYQISGTNVIIEKGTPIFISLYGMHSDPRFFDEPHVYNPDRFADGNQISRYAFMPVGMGPRMCIGVKMANLHMKIILSMILREYEMWQMKENKVILDSRSTFTVAANGIKLHFRKIIE